MWLFVSFLVSGIGFVAFSYGRRMKRAPQFLAGIVLMVFPYFTTNILAMLVIAAFVLGAMWAAIRLQY